MTGVEKKRGSDGLWDGVLASKRWCACLYARAYISTLGANIEHAAEEYVICRVHERKYNVQSETLAAQCMSNRGAWRCTCQSAGMGCRMHAKGADLCKLVCSMLSFAHAHVCVCKSVCKGDGRWMSERTYLEGCNGYTSTRMCSRLIWMWCASQVWALIIYDTRSTSVQVLLHLVPVVVHAMMCEDGVRKWHKRGGPSVPDVGVSHSLQGHVQIGGGGKQCRVWMEQKKGIHNIAYLRPLNLKCRCALHAWTSCCMCDYVAMHAMGASSVSGGVVFNSNVDGNGLEFGWEMGNEAFNAVCDTEHHAESTIQKS